MIELTQNQKLFLKSVKPYLEEDNIQAVIESARSTFVNTEDISTICAFLSELGLPMFEGLSEVPILMFYDSPLTSIEIPSNIKVIRRNAFEECRQLTSVTFNEGLEYIGLEAFKGCSSLTSIVLPDSLADEGTTIHGINMNAFEGCKSLKSITLTSYIGISPFAFYGCSAYLYVPESLYYRNGSSDRTDMALYYENELHGIKEVIPMAGK